MSNTVKRNILKCIALVLDILPPLVATLTQFPVWVQQSAEATVSGIVIVFAVLCCIPFLKQIIAYFKSPSVPVMWLIIFVLLTLLQNIINQMVVVCFVGVISNTIGTIIYKIGENIGTRED